MATKDPTFYELLIKFNLHFYQKAQNKTQAAYWGYQVSEDDKLELHDDKLELHFGSNKVFHEHIRLQAHPMVKFYEQYFQYLTFHFSLPFKFFLERGCNVDISPPLSFTFYLSPLKTQWFTS